MPYWGLILEVFFTSLEKTKEKMEIKMHNNIKKWGFFSISNLNPSQNIMYTFF